MMIAVIKLSLRIRGFSVTLRHIDSRPPRQPVHALVSAQAHRVSAMVRAMAAFVPGRHECLEQALCLTWALRRQGHPAQLIFGGRGYPFYVHAWVEVEGQVINDADDHVNAMLRLNEVK